MRISDWSSDVCSSDLTWGFPVGARLPIRRAQSQGREGPMTMTPDVKAILDNYESDNPGVKANLARILMQGRLGGAGKLIILPVDQGFAHGPARSFAVNPDAYYPHYTYQIATAAGLSAHAQPRSTYRKSQR